MHLIYIPGLGDGGVTKPGSFQGFAVRSWKFWGVKSTMFQINWADGKPFAPKLERLLTLIDQLATNDKVALVCASAGATAALQAYEQRGQNIHGVVCIAGKINNSTNIHPAYERRAKSFWESSQTMETAVNGIEDTAMARVLSIRGLIDPIVPARDSRLHGAVNRLSPTIGHAVTIGVQTLLGAPFFILWLRRLKP